MRPTDTEHYSDANSARKRLRAIGARPQKKVSTPEIQVFYSGAAKKWITAESDGDGGIELAFYDHCPCG